MIFTRILLYWYINESAGYDDTWLMLPTFSVLVPCAILNILASVLCFCIMPLQILISLLLESYCYRHVPGASGQIFFFLPHTRGGLCDEYFLGRFVLQENYHFRSLYSFSNYFGHLIIFSYFLLLLFCFFFVVVKGLLCAWKHHPMKVLVCLSHRLIT